MSGLSSDPALRRVAEAYSDLRMRLDALPQAADRRIALDAVRDALDRDAASASARPNFIAGSYAVDGSLHRGANFEVLRLRHRDLGTLHALKTLLPERRTDPLLRRVLQSEALHQARVIHPAVLPFRALLRLDDGRPGLLSDLVEAPLLSDVLRQRAFTESDVVTLGLRLAKALRAVHAAGLVHGDLSPANLFLPGGDPGCAILFDFGLSRPFGTCLCDDLEKAGTESFAAPETVDRKTKAHPSADLHAFGRLLRVASGPAPSRPLDRVLCVLTSVDPSARPDLADAVRYLESCGSRATDGRQNEPDPATRQSASP